MSDSPQIEETKQIDDSFSSYLENLQDDINKHEQISMPKLPINPYLRFHSENINKFQQRHPNTPLNKISEHVKEEWNTLGKLVKQKYIDSYKEDYQEYLLLKKEFRELTLGPKKPMTPYFRFHAESMTSYRQKYPTKQINELTQMIATKWQGLSQQQKNPYFETYAEDKQTYLQKLDFFKQNRDSWLYFIDYQNKKQQYEQQLSDKFEQYKIKIKSTKKVSNKDEETEKEKENEQNQDNQKNKSPQSSKTKKQMAQEPHSKIAKKINEIMSDIEENEDTEEPEIIIGEKEENGKKFLLVKWKNQNSSQNRWIDRNDLIKNYKKFVLKYEKIFNDKNKKVKMLGKLKTRGQIEKEKKEEETKEKEKKVTKQKSHSTTRASKITRRSRSDSKN